MFVSGSSGGVVLITRYVATNGRTVHCFGSKNRRNRVLETPDIRGRLTMAGFLVFIISALLVFVWWDGMASKEVARDAGARACREHQVQFLDDTVALQKLRLRRDPRGTLKLYRVYGFEFTGDGEFRHGGTIHMLGQHLLKLEMSHGQSTEPG